VLYEENYSGVAEASFFGLDAFGKSELFLRIKPKKSPAEPGMPV
jgi:hypothetical protein